MSSPETRILTLLRTIPAQKARATLARRRLAAFIREGWHVLEPATPLLDNWHIDAIADHVQALLDDWRKRQTDPTFVQRMQNLRIHVPPGTAKSRLVSVFAPAWMWLHCPSWKVLCLSCNPRVALRDAQYSRELIESPWYREWFQPDWTMAEDQNAKGLFQNTAMGFRASCGWTAKIVGDRADAIFMDDPHDPEEVESDVQRTNVTDRYDGTIANRVNDLRTSVRVLIMQRLHEGDMGGHVAKQGDWAQLVLPMEYEPQRYELPPEHVDHIPRETPIGWRDPRTKEGEILHEERFPPKVLDAEKRRLRHRAAGQLAQRPAPATGGMFRRAYWRFWKPDGVAAGGVPRPAGCWDGPAVPCPKNWDAVVVSLDPPLLPVDSSDFAAWSVWGVKGANRFLLARVKAHQTARDMAETALRLAREYSASKTLIENTALGPAVYQLLEGKLAGLIAITPKEAKQVRATRIQHYMEGGNVFLPEGAPYLEEYVGEFAIFPNGLHDDEVDSCTQALNYLQQNRDGERAEALANW